MTNYALRVPESLFTLRPQGGGGRACLNEPVFRYGHCRKGFCIEDRDLFS